MKSRKKEFNEYACRRVENTISLIFIQADFRAERQFYMDSFLNLYTNFFDNIISFNSNSMQFEFKEYKFKDFPDQVRLKNYLFKEYVNCSGELYWAGTKYESIDALYAGLEEQKLIGEIYITEKI